MNARRIAGLLVLFLSAACGDDDPAPAADSGAPDAAHADGSIDAALTDTGTVDAALDAGTDAPPIDAGSVDADAPDALPPDASAVDAGPSAYDLLMERLCEPFATTGCSVAPTCGCDAPTEDCEGSFRAICDQYFVGELRRELEAGTVTANLHLAEACAVHMTAYFEACETLPAHVGKQICGRVTAHATPIGEPCSDGYCAGGDGTCLDGLCQALPDIGEPCEYACKDVALCVNGTCVVPGAAESPCSTSRDCVSPLRCLAGACTAALEVGADCEYHTDCVAGALCVDGSCAEAPATCGALGECGLFEDCRGESFDGICDLRGGPGAPCDEHRDCNTATFCDYEIGRCAPRLAMDADCAEPAQCERPLTCDVVTRTCGPLATLDEPCAVFDPESPVCDDGLACVLGVCRPSPGVGEICSDDYRCAEGAGCVFGFDAAICMARQPSGAPCTSDEICVPDAFCNWETGFCEPRREVSAPCRSDSWCASEKLCWYAPDAEIGECRPVPTLGESCTYLCADGLTCGLRIPDGRCESLLCDVFAPIDEGPIVID